MFNYSTQTVNIPVLIHVCCKVQLALYNTNIYDKYIEILEKWGSNTLGIMGPAKSPHHTSFSRDNVAIWGAYTLL